MNYREPLYERRRQSKRQRRRTIWACVHMAIFAASTTFILSRAAQMQDFVNQQPVESLRPPERSLADLLDPAEQEAPLPDEPEEPQEWELVFDFSVITPIETPGDVDVSLNTRITVRAMTMNLAGREVSFRRRGVEAAVRSQQRIILRTSNQLAVAVARRQQLTNWLSSVGTKAITARAAAKNEVAARLRTITTLQAAIAAQQKVLRACLATVKLGDSLDGSPATRR